jgi:hypothetical protein
LERSRPVLGDEGRLQPGKVRVAHAHEAPLSDLEDASGVVAEPGAAGENAPVHVELLLVRDDLGVRRVEPGTALSTERQR